jgi:hypothetical protein
MSVRNACLLEQLEGRGQIFPFFMEKVVLFEWKIHLLSRMLYQQLDVFS